MNRNREFYGTQGGVYSKVLKTLPVFVLVLLISLTGCQNNGYPGGWPIFPPMTSGLDKLESEEVASALDVAGIIKDLDNPPDGMSVKWSIESGSSGGSSSLSRLAMPFADGQSSTAVTLVATVTFSGYSGNGLNTESGISEISRGTIKFTFKGSQVTANRTVTANLTDFKAKTISALSFVQTNGVLSNDYSVYTSEMTGTVSVTVSYSEETTSGVISKADVNVSAGDTIINSGSSITVGNDTIVDNTWKGGMDDSWYEENKNSFEISTPEQLAGLAQLVNGGKNFSGKTITLTSDLDLGNVDWTPIGMVNYSVVGNIDKDWSKFRDGESDSDFLPFKGTFNGDGHVINNLYIKGSNTVAADPFERELLKDSCYLGLFGVIGDGADISNLTVNNINIQNGCINIGGIIGYLCGTTSADPASATLDELHATGSIMIEGHIANVGGIIGRSAPCTQISISNCEVSAEAGSFIESISETTSNFIGGIIGIAYGSDSDSALVMTNCSSNLNIECDVQGVGGLAGGVFRGSIANCEVNSEITLYPYAGDSWNDHLSIGAIAGIYGSSAKTSVSFTENTGTVIINSWLADGETLANNGIVGHDRNGEDNSGKISTSNNSIIITHNQLAAAE